MRDKVKRPAGGRNHPKADVSPPSGVPEAFVMNADDSSFPVKVQGAGLEMFEMQVHGFWQVQDTVMALTAREEVCPRSSFSLALAGAPLDPLVDLKSLRGLRPGSVLRLVEEPYSPQSARAHLGRVLELLRTSGPQDALKEGRSPSVLETLTNSPGAAKDGGSPTGQSLKRSLSVPKAEAGVQDGTPPEYLLPGSLERPLMALLPHSSQTEGSIYLRDLSLSCWNPPPGHRKLQGDFLYVTVVTLEGSRYDVTSCPKGFYVNRSTEEVFDPRPVQASPLCHCFTDLLGHLSPAFKQALSTAKTRAQLPPAEVLPTPYRTVCWLGPAAISRTQRNTFSRLGLDQQAAAQAPDWNEELQAARDLPQGTLEERLWRDRTLLQVNSAFVLAAAQGAETLVDGFAETVSAGREEAGFLWGGVFMSQGSSSAGGERGRRAAQRLELSGVQAYSDLGELQALHTLPTATVDYRGVRLSAQGLAPGSDGPEPEAEPEADPEADPEAPAPPPSRGLMYGLNAGPQESPRRRQLLVLLAQSAKALSLQRHAVLGPAGYQVPLFTSVDAQGLLGGDGRFYLLDLVRTMPADANFCPEVEAAERALTAGGQVEEKVEEVKEDEEVKEEEEKDKVEVEEELKEAAEEKEVKEEAKEEVKEEERPKCSEAGGDRWPKSYHSDTGLPRRYPHGLCRLRRELWHAFVQHKHTQFNQRVRELMEEDGGFEECAKPGDARATKAVRAACEEVGSVSHLIFEMRFNPNVFCPGVSFPGGDSAATRLQERLLREAAAFIIKQQIPDFVDYCLQGIEVPMDSATLKQALHHWGINLRYLGHVIKAISQSEHKERLRHILRVALAEVVVRSARRVFNSFVQSVEVWSLSAAVSHFLCCLLVPQFTPATAGEEPKKKSKRRGGRGGAGASETPAWSAPTGAALTGPALWNLVRQDALETYDITAHLGASVSHVVEQNGLQRLSLLREFCLKTGVQLRLRDYCLDNQSKAPIGPDDVLNIFPLVKHIHMPVSDAFKAFRAAQTFIEKGLLDQAQERLKETSYLFGRVCDELHPEACHCLSTLARVTFLQGKTAEARSAQLKAVMLSERVLGFDHPSTIQQYALLAVYLGAGGEKALAQKCLLRARHLVLTVHGEDHPYVATLDGCLGLLLTGEAAGQYLESALKLNMSFFGPTDTHTALSQHLLSQWLCSKGDYRSAMSHEKEAQAAYSAMFGEDHKQTKGSAEFLRTITQQAVRVERSRREAPDVTEPAAEGLKPSSETVLEQLALLTGIRKNAQSNRLQEFKKRFWEIKLAEATEKVKVINERLVSAKTKREGESTPAGAAAGGEGAAGAAVCPENGDGGAEHPEEALPSGGQEIRPAEEPSEESRPSAAVNGLPEERSAPGEPEQRETEREEVELHAAMNGGPDVEGDDAQHKETETGETVRPSEGTVNGGEEVKRAGSHEETNGVNGVHDDDDDEDDTDPSGLEKKKEHFVEVNAKSTKANEAVVNGVIVVNGGAGNGVVVNGAPEE
ncbi:clustered mitochondria protein homolog isoform X1 [Gadus macrocephalus]|uniref:clustered mitochondria protein homolog isoform X1 n=1 Tax=Gadus macrocephalus TaxID=80720 RepID=UPI0028CBBFB7|nr:clustered mitochondria protein homolog isoform X1 [Gadus macrocephalus]